MLLSVSVSAQTLFTAEYETIKAGITPGGVAEFNITIENFEDTSKVFTLGLAPSDSSNWIVSPSSTTVDGNSKKSILAKFFPKSSAGLGTYLVSLKVEASDGSKQTLKIPLSIVLDAFYSGYQPDVALNVVSPEKQDPREKLKVVVFVRNRNQLDIENLIIDVQGDLFSKQFNTTLGPRKEKSRDILFDLNPLEEPGTYSYTVKLIYAKKDRVVAESEKTFEIEGYSKITPKFKSTSSWFLTTDTITLENEGNYARSKEVSVSAPWYKRMFTSTEPKAQLIEVDGDKQLMWAPEVKPTETVTITIVRNYRPSIIAVVILVLLIIAYFVFRNPVVIVKETAVVKEDNEGISEMKVRVFLKNRSAGTLHNITVTDRIPRITEYVDKAHMGSLKPSRVTTTSKKGTLLYWDIDRLESYEERILTYRAISKLKIVGDISMPKIKVKFESAIGKERRKVSGPPLFVRK